LQMKVSSFNSSVREITLELRRVLQVLVKEQNTIKLCEPMNNWNMEISRYFRNGVQNTAGFNKIRSHDPCKKGNMFIIWVNVRRVEQNGKERGGVGIEEKRRRGV